MKSLSISTKDKESLRFFLSPDYTSEDEIREIIDSWIKNPQNMPEQVLNHLKDLGYEIKL